MIMDSEKQDAMVCDKRQISTANNNHELDHIEEEQQQ